MKRLSVKLSNHNQETGQQTGDSKIRGERYVKKKVKNGKVKKNKNPGGAGRADKPLSCIWCQRVAPNEKQPWLREV